MMSASGRRCKKAMALGPEFREDPATITPEERARRAGILANQRAPADPGSLEERRGVDVLALTDPCISAPDKV